jgi:SAM-dependent methyltransferase
MDDHHPLPHHHDPVEADPRDAMIEMLDLDAEVFDVYLFDAIAWVSDLASSVPCRRILDLGSGTGTAAIALARAFPRADVLAVDSSADLLDRVTTRARDLGMEKRVTTLLADLDKPWPITEMADVVWASRSLHHLTDPDRVLADLFTGIRAGGVLAIAEMDGLPRFLPDDIGVGLPGLEARCHAALAETLSQQLPHLGADWGERLSGAGFAAVSKRSFSIDLDPPLPPSTGRYAMALFRRVRAQLDGTIGTDDVDTLDALIDPEGSHSLLARQDLVVRGERTLWAGTRP